MTSKQNLPKDVLYQRNLKSASANLLLFAVLSVVNVLLLLSNAGISFTFSAFLPEFLIGLGAEFSAASGSNGPLVVYSVIAVFFIVGCIVSALLAKKRPLWLILGLALALVDTVCMVLIIVPIIDVYLESGVGSLVIYFLFHAWVLYYLINGLVSYTKLKKLPVGPVVYQAPFVPEQANEVPASETAAPAITEDSASVTPEPEEKDET